MAPKRARPSSQLQTSTSDSDSDSGTDAASIDSSIAAAPTDPCRATTPAEITLTREDAAMLDSYDERMLALLAQELLDVQALKRDTDVQIALLLEEQKKLEIMERREKTHESQTASQRSRLSRIQQLQEQERVRHEQLAAARAEEERMRVAREEEARRKQANSIETRDHDDDEDLDAFLAQESSYF